VEVTFEEGVFCKTNTTIDHPDIEAIFLHTDLVAVIHLNENKIKVPEQVALMGFSNWFMSVPNTKVKHYRPASHEIKSSEFNLLEQMNSQRKGTHLS
jgi:LacI family transcriptional regulator